jgi:hypothetical protein
VKGARLFYEDGAIARAVELLAVRDRAPAREVKHWLALFEIFRLERLTGEFAALAAPLPRGPRRRSVLAEGAVLRPRDRPGNALLRAAADLQVRDTIGPTQARRMAGESTFDPVAENWLGAPMDFENEVLANDLRKAVMAQAGIMEGGPRSPIPMPALRNVEMFTVA